MFFCQNRRSFARIDFVWLVAFVFACSFETTALTAPPQDSPSHEISLAGVASIAGDSLDLSGLNEVLIPEAGTTEDTIAPGTQFTNNMLGGISGIAWTGKEDLYWCLPDRGPLDGAVDWSCRIHLVRISIRSDVDQQARRRSTASTQIVSTVLLRDKRGIPFTGLASAFAANEATTRRLDPEAVRVGADGNLFISDEYGPRLIEFTPNGHFVREFTTPKHLLVDNPGVSKSTENPKNVSGRQSNRGMEGLAISPDGKRLFGLMQSSLLQDSYRQTPTDKPLGANCRLPVFCTTGEFSHEYAYPLENSSNKLNEILACDENHLITIERDGLPGAAAQFKKLMLISVSEASDIRGVEKLSPDRIGKGRQGVDKHVFIDLLDPKWNLAGVQMPEKIEGLAFGPDFSNGDRLLLVASDNDFIKENSTEIFLFRIPQIIFEFAPEPPLRLGEYSRRTTN
jgi:hypothetical protein